MFGTWKPGMADLSQPDKVKLDGITIVAEGIGIQVREILQEQITRIFREHGPRAFECPKPATAIHEAGHVVVDTVLGKHVKRVSIGLRSGVWLGCTECSDGKFAVHSSQVAEQTKLARHFYAGLAAESFFPEYSREGSSLDELILSQLAGKWAAMHLGQDDRTYWNTEVHEWTCKTLTRHKAVCVGIANHLLQHHRLKNEPLARFCEAIKTAEPGFHRQTGQS
jgi:hypothetical protein